jgi:hypothetical protein
MPLEHPFVVTQLPAGTEIEKLGPVAGGMLRAPYGEGGRLVVVAPGVPPRVITRQFHSACDADVSFDGARILFAAKRAVSDPWNVFEMAVDGSGLRQVTKDLGDCRSPGYQSTLYRIIPNDPKRPPWHQLTFVSDRAGGMNEYGPVPATDLYSCKADGSEVRRLTFNLSSDVDPVIMSDGRLLFAAWQRSRLDHGPLGRVGLFGVNVDGADYALFAGYEGKRVKHMPCVTAGGLVVFVETDRCPWDGAGQLSSVSLRRPLDSYRPLTKPSDGLFHSPSPLPDGRILVSRRPRDGSHTHGVYRLDPESGKAEPLFDDSRYHEIQARVIHPCDEPDGRSSVVDDQSNGKLYCLNVYLSDLEEPDRIPPGSVQRLRVLAGVPLKRPACVAAAGLPSLVPRRVLGEIPVENDGSFHVEVPPDTPIELQLVDADGTALRSCGWIWAKHREPRGCIGCHEDGELVPENRYVDAAARPAHSLRRPVDERPTVDFRSDVMPIVTKKCAPCHREGKTEPFFDRGCEVLLTADEPGAGSARTGKYVHPGRARTSPLVWHLFGRNTSRPWDGPAAGRPVKPMPPDDAEPLTESERRTLVEWIDLGALWDAAAVVVKRPKRRMKPGENP